MMGENPIVHLCIGRNCGIRFCYLILSLWSCLNAQGVTSLPASLRRIQLDGFLLEWKESSAKIWREDSSVAWDARTTPEGIAGYFRARVDNGCAKWVFRIYASTESSPLLTEMSGESEGDSIFRVSYGDSVAVIEWLMPWRRIALDSAAAFSLKLMAIDACGDTLRAKLIAADSGAGPIQTIIKHVKIDFILIGLLLGAYLLLRAKAKKMSRRGAKDALYHEQAPD